jgi:hypothetical protein
MSVESFDSDATVFAGRPGEGKRFAYAAGEGESHYDIPLIGC